MTPMGKARKQSIDRWLKNSVHNPMRGSHADDDIVSIIAPSRPSVKDRVLFEDLDEAISQNLESLNNFKTGGKCISKADSDVHSLAGVNLLQPGRPKVSATLRKSVNLDKLELDIQTVELGVKNFITKPPNR
jgi:hypothetical protein